MSQLTLCKFSPGNCVETFFFFHFSATFKDDIMYQIDKGN